MSDMPGDEQARYQPPWGQPSPQRFEPLTPGQPDIAQGQAQVQPWALAQPPPGQPPPGQPYPPVPPGWGQPMMYQQVQPHSAALAVVASFFVPGLGSMLNERVGKGIAILVASIVAWVSAIILIGFILGPAVWIFGMVTANNDAHKWNRAHGILS